VASGLWPLWAFIHPYGHGTALVRTVLVTGRGGAGHSSQRFAPLNQLA